MASSRDAEERLKSALADRYTIEREIGIGGMATVFLAEDLKHHRKVALKILWPELSAVVGSERFVAEIKTTANLLHPNTLPLFDSGWWLTALDRVVYSRGKTKPAPAGNRMVRFVKRVGG